MNKYFVKIVTTNLQKTYVTNQIGTFKYHEAKIY